MARIASREGLMAKKSRSHLASRRAVRRRSASKRRPPRRARPERSEIREVFARVKAIWDTSVDTPAMAGPSIPIQTADGRESWGPAPPPGTPPAGSPDSPSLSGQSS